MSDELASLRRERGTVSTESLTSVDLGSNKDVSPTFVPQSLRRFCQGFTGVQLDSDFSWHRFQLWVPTFFLRLLPA